MCDFHCFLFLFTFNLLHSSILPCRSHTKVTGTVRHADCSAAPAGVEVYQLDSACGEQPEVSGLLDGVTHILVTAPPNDAVGDPVLHSLGHELRSLPAGQVQWLGYLSTTGVYGNCDGGEVTEETPCDATSSRGRLRVQAEEAWTALGLRTHIFRLPGIYGPGRGTLEKLRSGTTSNIVHKPGHFFNRIHVDDIVQTVLASMARPAVSMVRLYNVVDDEPAESETVNLYSCRLLGMAPPPIVPFEQAKLSPMARSFYADNKRCTNARIKEELGVVLLYPTYREGLTAQLAEEQQQEQACISKDSS